MQIREAVVNYAWKEHEICFITLMMRMEEKLMRTEFQDLNCTDLFRLPMRTTVVPYPNASAAKTGERAASPYFCSLNGRWDFTYYAAPADVA